MALFLALEADRLRPSSGAAAPGVMGGLLFGKDKHHPQRLVLSVLRHGL